MPRYKELFTLFPRKLSSGKTIWYYRTYTPDGIRTVAHSTGQTSKTLARTYCQELHAKGLLSSNIEISFSKYAEHFFDDNAQWLNDKIQSGKGKVQPVSINTLKAYRHNNKDILIPYFKNQKLCNIQPIHIKKFRNELIEKGFSNSAINLACACLKIIFSYAIADRIIQKNPFDSVQQMYIDAHSKQAFKVDELKIILFHIKDYERKIFILTAALTGMRISEIAAIRKERLHRDFIDVSDQLLNNQLVPVKDDGYRKVRISESLYKALDYCVRKNNGFAFHENQDTYRTALYRAMEISKEKRIEKGLSFHSLRHFFNTYMLSHKVPEIKVKSIMGHSSGKGSITERYTNFTPSDFDDISELQESLLKVLLF